MWFFKKKKVNISSPEVYFSSKRMIKLYDINKKDKYACIDIKRRRVYINKAKSVTYNISTKTLREVNDNLYISGHLDNGDSYYISVVKYVSMFRKSETRIPLYKCEVNVEINPDKMQLYPVPPHILYVFQ